MRVLWNHILQSPKSHEELAVINVTTATFGTINSGSGSRLGFTTLGAFSEPAMDGRDLWSPGQETIVFVTLLICPYDSSFILPDIYVVPLTCTLKAQTDPELNHVKVKGVFMFSWRGGRYHTPHPHGSVNSPNDCSKISCKKPCPIGEGSHGGRVGD